MGLDDFCRLPEAVGAGLIRAEVLSLRLYTGKPYRAINASCRNLSDEFAFTVYCINNALGKLGSYFQRTNAASATPLKLEFYRGAAGRLRSSFESEYKAAASDAVRLGVLADLALVSTSTDVSVATGPFGGNLLYVFCQDKISQEQSDLIDGKAQGDFELRCFPGTSLPAAENVLCCDCDC